MLNITIFYAFNKFNEMFFNMSFQDRAKDAKSPLEKIVALKKIRMENEKEGLPMSALREISLLLKCDHENIVRLQEVLVGKSLDR